MFIKIVLILYFFTLCVCDDSLLSQFDKKIPTLDDGSLYNLTSIEQRDLRKAKVHLDLPEGADCDWEGVKGKCVKETRCLTTLAKQSDPHPVCSTKGDDKIVCCTDCELVNSTRNIVFGRQSHFWKDGTKARDSCLDYLKTLRSMCRDGYDSGIFKLYNEEKKCYTSRMWNITVMPAALGVPDGVEYPHQALLGYGNDLESAKWEASGTIISNKYILTVAHIGKLLFQGGPLRYIALGIMKLTDDPSTWQIHKLKRLIRHPDYKQFSLYNDIALIETKDTISFNEHVLPACLPMEAGDADSASYTTWIQLESSYYVADAGVRAHAVDVAKFSEEECKNAYSPFKTQFSDGIDYNKQICYGTKEQSRRACKGNSGEPLMMLIQLDGCISIVSGVMSFGRSQCGSKHNYPDVYTRVAYYKPWIESVVWP